MRLFDHIPSEGLDRRELQLIITACSVIIVLAIGLILFMYPAVFSAAAAAPNRLLSVAFFGFCGLSVLLACYLVDRQLTIQRLRLEIDQDRKRAADALTQASSDLLGAVPNFSSFQDRLPMEFRRAAAAKKGLVVLVIKVKLSSVFIEPSQALSALGDAAKAISRRLREQDSIYILREGYFGIILPEVDATTLIQIRTRLVECLTDAAGAAKRFSFDIQAASFPDQASSAYDLELAVRGFLPDDRTEHTYFDTAPIH